MFKWFQDMQRTGSLFTILMNGCKIILDSKLVTRTMNDVDLGKIDVTTNGQTSHFALSVV